MLALAGLVVSMGQSLFLPVLPELPGLLDTTADEASWLITITLMAGAVGIPAMSRLADMYGKRRIVLVTLMIVAIGGVIGAVGDSYFLVLVSRAMQGIGLAIIPVGTSIMRDELPRERLGTAVALMSTTLGIGSALGMPMSGFIYLHFGWHALFWVSAILAAVFFVGVAIVVPESPIRTGGRFDIVGALILSGILITLLLGITKGGHWGWTSSTTGLCLLSFALLVAFWVPWELRNRQPVVDLRSSSARPVLLTNIISLLAGFAMYANWLTATAQLQLPETLEYGFGQSPVQIGMLMLPAACMMVIVSPISAAITRRHGARLTLILGSFVLMTGYLVRLIPVSHSWQIMMGAMVVTTGTAITYSALPVMIMRWVPVTETAAANGLNTVVRSVGTATASATAAAVLTTVTLMVGDKHLPTVAAFSIVHLLAASAAGIAAVVCFALPRRSPITEEARSPLLADEAVVHGLVIDNFGAPAGHACVHVTIGSEELDWATCDESGAFVVAVPTDRQYELVATAHQHGVHRTEGLGSSKLHENGTTSSPQLVVLVGESRVNR